MRKASILLFFWACAGLAQVKDCAALAGFTLPGVPLEMRRAEMLPAGSSQSRQGPPGPAGPALPAHCRVEGVINRRTGVGGKEYGINFALALPDSWNGRFLFQGGGGLNGTV
ncbi:MAG: hypothetical protein K6T61_11520, partial [Bryobacteraceae bacterium]|nr:hypothetical protein [Bryobacteraceae bacterium]